MAIRYKGWSLSGPIIRTLTDGSGYTVFNIDISREVGPTTETRALWTPGKFPTADAAREAAIAGVKRFIDET